MTSDFGFDPQTEQIQLDVWHLWIAISDFKFDERIINTKRGEKRIDCYFFVTVDCSLIIRPNENNEKINSIQSQQSTSSLYDTVLSKVRSESSQPALSYA